MVNHIRHDSISLRSLSTLFHYKNARIYQTRVTRELRSQARQAVEQFTQEVLYHPANGEKLLLHVQKDELARALWHEGLILIYRLLFILKLESSDDPARAFSFSSTSLWRNSYSPSMALAPVTRDVLDKGAETGYFLEQGLRAVFLMFSRGLECTELNIKPVGGALFGENATPVISSLQWGERAVAHLIDKLLWTPRGKAARERVHYGSLDVEDLGRVYEALLELEPGITTDPMCRLRRQKLEVVVPLAQGGRYRPLKPSAPQDATADDAADEQEEDSPRRGKKTKVEWIEEIPGGCFYLRVGLGRKASGSYYTPHSFVRFLVQETLAPQVLKRSPREDPDPCAFPSPHPFLAHSALRLTCNHEGYEPLWREQVGDAWREERAAFTWPVLEGNDARWAVRAAVDAVVAEAYGLTREQYAHVLSGFSHRSYPKAPGLCLACFDELKSMGLEEFTAKYDPYRDIPLNEKLPEPVIEIPLAGEEEPVRKDSQQMLLFG